MCVFFIIIIFCPRSDLSSFISISDLRKRKKIKLKKKFKKKKAKCSVYVFPQRVVFIYNGKANASLVSPHSVCVRACEIVCVSVCVKG